MARHTPIIVRVPGENTELWLRPCDARKLVRSLQRKLLQWEGKRCPPPKIGRVSVLRPPQENRP